MTITSFGVPLVVGGECCDAYYDLAFQYHDPKWCSSYCCGTSVVLECCDNFLLQAPTSDRTSVCWDFFVRNVWALILPIIGGIVIILGCACFFYYLCKGSKSSGSVVHPMQQPQHNNMILLPASGYSNQVQGPYGQPAGPGAYPPAYPPSTALYSAQPIRSEIPTNSYNRQTDSKQLFQSSG